MITRKTIKLKSLRVFNVKFGNFVPNFDKNRPSDVIIIFLGLKYGGIERSYISLY